MKERGTRSRGRAARGRCALAAALAALLLASGGTTKGSPLPGENTAAADAPRRGRTVVYVYDSAEPVFRPADGARIDQMNYAFALIRNGEASGAHWQGMTAFTRFLQEHPHIDGVLSVGGWGADGFSQACASESGRRRLADSILALMDRCGLVGVDIDWEYPGVAAGGIAKRDDDLDNWYALLALLRAGLDARAAANGRPYRLSAALSASAAYLERLDAARLDALLDQAVVMAYDLCGFEKQTGHHAALGAGLNRRDTGAYAVARLTARGLSTDKILLGIPAYGRVWRRVADGGQAGLGQSAGTTGIQTIGYAAMQALEDSGYTHYYDEAAQAAWWYDGSTFVSGEDARSLREKAEWALRQGLLGTAVWEYGDDDGSLCAVLDSALHP